jgi:hypothetical protein
MNPSRFIRILGAVSVVLASLSPAGPARVPPGGQFILINLSADDKEDEPATTEAWRASLENTLADPRCRFLCIFNWLNIATMPPALDAIRAVVSSTAAPAKP